MQQNPPMDEPSVTMVTRKRAVSRSRRIIVPTPLFYCGLLLLLVAAGVIVGVVIHNQPSTTPSVSSSLHVLKPQSKRVESNPKYSTHLKFEKRSDANVAEVAPPSTQETSAESTHDEHKENRKKPVKPHHFYHDTKKNKDKEKDEAKKTAENKKH
jgi:hypothetical protein